MTGVYLHGLGQSPSDWQAVLRNWGGQFLCPDLARWGCAYETLYARFSALCRDLSGPLHLCGLSLGGMLALRYGAEHPERTASLVLIGARVSVPGGLLRLQNLLFRLTPARAFSGSGFDRKGMIALCRSMMELDLGQYLPAIACSTLVVCGERDTANRQAAEEIAAAVLQARLEIIPGAGHAVNTDAPEALAALLQEFYRQLEN